ncbi:MAG: hypothetical protein ABJE47_23350 [bacterium]
MRIAHLENWPTSARIAGAGLFVALVFDAVVLVQSRSLQNVEIVAPLTIGAAPGIVVIPAADAELVQMGASRTPFDLTAPTPAVNPLTALASQPVPQPPPRPRLVGTVVQAQGGFVVLELPDLRMQVVRIGERAAGLRLRSVAAGEAVFDDLRGNRVSLRTSPPGAESRP